jgi:ABC-type xylose transport system substrate-binding protein
VKKAAAIVLCPCDSQGIGAVIKEANDAGIPVFTADIANLSSEGKVVAHIATDNEDGGRLAAEAMSWKDTTREARLARLKSSPSCRATESVSKAPKRPRMP